MTDDEMQLAVAIAKEHWLEISGQTTVWLLPHPDESDEQLFHTAKINQGQVLEHGDYRFIYVLKHDELFIGRADEEF